jgi:hypothetical protein
VYDQAFERAGSGESLTLQILNVEGNAAVIHAWVSQQPMSGCPLEITRMDELVTYFASSAKSNTIFRYIPHLSLHFWEFLTKFVFRKIKKFFLKVFLFLEKKLHEKNSVSRQGLEKNISNAGNFEK